MDDIKIYTCRGCGRDIGEEEAHIWDVWRSPGDTIMRAGEKIALCPDCQAEVLRTGEMKFYDD